MTTAALQAERFEIPDDLWAAQAFFEEKGWGDGLPIIPPTEDRVSAMLAATKRQARGIIGAVPPRWAQATVEKIAINGVMAGCKPEYMPVLIAAVEAMTRSETESLCAASDHRRSGGDDHHQWPDPKGIEHQRRSQCFGRGMARQRDHRPLRATGETQYRRLLSRHDLQSDFGLAGKIFHLRR